MADTHDIPAHDEAEADSVAEPVDESLIDGPVTADATAPDESLVPDLSGEPSDSTEAEVQSEAIDLDQIESDLADVERSLARLADDTYWVDEVTGEPIPDEVLIASPTARRATHH